jgi:hypothetical protein
MGIKDKKAAQALDKQKHKAQLKLKRRTATSFERNKPVLSEKPTILIVCEGKNTEPSYFNQFRLTSATIRSVGEGFNTLSLVNRAIQIANQTNYDQVWCVFDKDNFDESDFNNAILLAETNGFGVAYSNQAFEYWILLHFNDHQGGGMHRDEYNDKLNKLLKEFKLFYDGKKTKLVTEEIFELLDGIDEKTGKERKVLAIDRAKKIFKRHGHHNPARNESSTTVYKLVSELLKYL